ncbi:hypothetical protein [Siccirubricoccus sp. G192]|uniref:hypothetical protein n=1 Tax=Siccirubricoccus sp. G192 TaxID=2849651 RepID=UPI001C2C6625|nr:hypothetical protein [Siccirubricoccus sp. G192]MBV1798719.1 hypothetical protein [Siccirubricoccus sp. G192]
MEPGCLNINPETMEMSYTQNDLSLPFTRKVARRFARQRFTCANAAIWNAAMAALGEGMPPESTSEPLLSGALAGGAALIIDAEEPTASRLISWWRMLEDTAPWPMAVGQLWGAPLGAHGPAMVCAPGGEAACLDRARLILGPSGDRLAVAELPAAGCAVVHAPIELEPLPSIAHTALRACGGSLEELFRRAMHQVEPVGDGSWRVRVARAPERRPIDCTAPRIS